MYRPSTCWNVLWQTRFPTISSSYENWSRNHVGNIFLNLTMISAVCGLYAQVDRLWFMCWSLFGDKREIKHRDPQNRVNIGMYVFTSQSPILWPAQSRFGIPLWQLAFVLRAHSHCDSHITDRFYPLFTLSLSSFSRPEAGTLSLNVCDVCDGVWLFLTDIAHRLSCNETTFWKLIVSVCMWLCA